MTSIQPNVVNLVTVTVCLAYSHCVLGNVHECTMHKLHVHDVHTVSSTHRW